MSLLDVRRVYVVQDRATGSFVDINMSFVFSLKHAARAESLDVVRESMNCALYDGTLDCPMGYDVHTFFVPANEWEASAS